MQETMPIAPDRFDNRPITVDDDANRAAMRQFARNALASGHAVEVDGKLYRPRRTKGREVPALHVVEEGDPRELEDAKPATVEQEVDLGADHEPRQIHLTTRDGHRHTLDVLITVESGRLMSWYLTRITDLQTKLVACEDEADVLDLARQIGDLQYKQVRLSVPNLPAGLLGSLSTDMYGRLLTTINEMLTADATVGSRPNAETAPS